MLDNPVDHRLSDSEVAHFSATGWVARRAMFSEAEAADLGRWTDELVALPEVPGRHMVYHEDSLIAPGERVMQRIEDFCPYHPAFDTLVRSGRLLASVERLLDERALLFKEKINFKRPGGAGFEAHQDQQAGWSAYAPMFITALVTLDPATIANGCLEMPENPRESQMIGEEWKPLTPEQMARSPLTPIPTMPGDVLFFDSYVPHASQPNTTGQQRRILYLTYNAARFGDHRRQYYDDKRANFPPDIERLPDREYRFRV